MTFRSLLTEIKTNFHLSPDWFGETVVYIPCGGTPRNINVHVYEEESLELQDIDTEDRSRVLKVKVLKDHVSGIDRPNLGDKIVRSAANDADDRPYVYQGEHDNESPDSWRLHFMRTRRDSQGVKGGK